MAARKPKVGDTYLLRAKVTRISDDGAHITLRVPIFDVPNTVTASILEGSDNVIDEQAMEESRKKR